MKFISSYEAKDIPNHWFIVKYLRTPFFIEHLWWLLLGLVFKYCFLFKQIFTFNFWKTQNIVAVTSNSLNKRSSFKESSFVLTQANYSKLQRTVKQKWNKRIFLISNLKVSIHFLFSFLVSHENENEMLVLWLAFNYIRRQQKLQEQSFANVVLNRCS